MDRTVTVEGLEKAIRSAKGPYYLVDGLLVFADEGGKLRAFALYDDPISEVEVEEFGDPDKLMASLMDQGYLPLSEEEE